MPDREKVIYDIERCICNVPDACRDCSHYTGTVGFGCMENLMSDVLVLLKEQETANLYKCPNCGTWVSAENVVRCKNCKHYKDGFCYNPNTYDDEKTNGNTVPDWFCADGERKTDDD